MGRLLNEDDVYALFAPNGTARLHVADIDVLPRVDAKEVVYGRWKRTSISGTLFCSVCDKIPEFQIETNYCPNCGAKMEGDGNA